MAEHTRERGRQRKKGRWGVEAEAEAERKEEGRGEERRKKKQSTTFFFYQSQRTCCSIEENIHIHNLPWRENLTKNVIKIRGRVKSINLLRSTVYIYELNSIRNLTFSKWHHPVHSHCLSAKETGQRARTGQWQGPDWKSFSPELQPPHTSHHQSWKTHNKNLPPRGDLSA